MKINFKIGNKYRQSLLKKKNVIGVGIGYREKGGQRTGEKAIIVFVTKKENLRQLDRSEIVPQFVQGQRVDVIEIGEVRFLKRQPAAARGKEGHFLKGNRLDQWRPAPGVPYWPLQGSQPEPWGRG